MNSPIDDNMEETEFYCARCGTSKDLYSLEQKNLKHQVIGVIFVCGECSDSLTGKQMQISFGNDIREENNVGIYEFDEGDSRELTGYETWN